jgi:hypothetical protein
MHQHTPGMSDRALIGIALRAVASVFAGGFLLWFAFSAWLRAYDGYLIERYWHPPDSPYSARVTDFPIWGNNGKVRTPTVTVAYANGKKAEFNSSRKGTYSTGDEVRVLMSSGESRLVVGGVVLVKKVYAAYEIDNPYLLWGKDASYGVYLLIAAAVVLAAGFAPVFALGRARRAAPAGEQPPPV